MASALKFKNDIGTEFVITHTDGADAAEFTSTSLSSINYVVDNVPEMRALDVHANTIAVKDGRYGSNYFRKIPNGVDNNGTVIRISNGTMYELQYTGPVYAQWFEINGTDDADLTRLGNALGTQIVGAVVLSDGSMNYWTGTEWDSTKVMPLPDTPPAMEISRGDRTVRYIRVWSNGTSDGGTTNYITEIQAFQDTINVALQKANDISLSASVPYSSAPGEGMTAEMLTDGNHDASSPSMTVGDGLQWLQLDMGQPFKIDTVKIYRPYASGKTYNDNRVEVSEDGQDWTIISDGNDYQETSEGKEWRYENPANRITDVLDTYIDERAEIISKNTATSIATTIAEDKSSHAKADKLNIPDSNGNITEEDPKAYIDTVATEKASHAKADKLNINISGAISEEDPYTYINDAVISGAGVRVDTMSEFEAITTSPNIVHIDNSMYGSNYFQEDYKRKR